jgi:hypothetical protein
MFVTKHEFVELLASALADGFKIQLDKKLPTPAPEYCGTRADIEREVGQGQYAFLLERGDFSRYPVKIRQVVVNGKEFWYPRSKEGGPVIDACYFDPFQKEGERYVPCSLFSCHTKIVTPGDRTVEPAGSAVVKALLGLVAPLQSASQKVKSSRKSAFVSPGVQEALASGAKLAEPFTAGAIPAG